MNDFIFRKGVSELAAALGVERSRLPYYTKNPMGHHYVQKLTPLLTYPALFDRKSVYPIEDPLLRFWFMFVYPNTSMLERLSQMPTSYQAILIFSRRNPSLRQKHSRLPSLFS